MKIALVQLSMSKDINANLKKSLEYCDKARDSYLLFFPEIQLSPFFPQYEKQNVDRYCLKIESDELVLVYQLGVLKAGTVVEISNLSVVETDEQITTAPVVTTADPYAPTESAPEGYTMITPNLNNWDTFGSKGQWKIYTGSTSEESHAYVAAKEGDTPYDINLNFVKTTANDEWQC
ncbi:hypothetical protein [uncultured Eubacterium sp.]|uniref:hypothetical protein n=2 Tax=Eubacterium TaxID=1730 RepID=UPI0026378355|nr:hypothetical protein [uncultured Eubacterium sp.]